MVRRFWIHSIQGKGGKIRLSQALQFYLWFPWAGSLMIHRLGTTPRQRSQSLRNPSNLGEIIPGEIMKLFDHCINMYKTFFLVNHLNSIYHYLSNLGPSIFIACWGLGTNLDTAHVMLPTRVAWSHPSHRRRSTGVEDGACWKHRQRQRMPDLSYFIVIWPTYLHLLLLLLALSIRGSVVYHLSSQDRNQVVDSRWMIWVQIFLPPKQMLRNST